MAGAAVRHHYVPQCLIRNFCDDSGHVWFSERDDSGLYKPPEQRNTKSVFCANYYYAIDLEGRPSDYIEKNFYQKIDDRLAKLIDRYLACAENGVLDISRAEEVETANLLFHLITRGPRYTSSYIDGDIELGRQLFNEILLAADIDDAESLDALEALKNRDRLKKAGRNIRVKVQASPPKEAKPYLEDLCVKIARSSGKHSFIISDLPVFRLGNGGRNGLLNDKVEIWLPIAPKVAIVMLRKEFSMIPNFHEIRRDKMRQLNDYVVRNASGIASHSGVLVEALLRGAR